MESRTEERAGPSNDSLRRVESREDTAGDLWPGTPMIEGAGELARGEDELGYNTIIHC